MDDLFDQLSPEDLPPCLNVSRAGRPRQPEPEPTDALAIEVPQATHLEDATRRWRDTFTAAKYDRAGRAALVAARHDVIMAARARETREHTIDWLGSTPPHLISVACSCGERLAGFILVDFAAAKVVAHIENGARL
jgi:hypothetical protein